jgi:hypothetical protein
MRSMLHPFLAVGILAAAIAACGGGTVPGASGDPGGSPGSQAPRSSPPSTPTFTPAAAPATPARTPAPTVEPTPDLTGPTYVVGTQALSLVEPGTTSTVDGVSRVRGLVARSYDAMNDPRVSGTATIHADIDTYKTVGPQSGTYRLENANGAWEGPWTGAGLDAAGLTDVSGWLVGSGAYKGWTYWFHSRGGGTSPFVVDGIVYPGPPPKQ